MKIRFSSTVGARIETEKVLELEIEVSDDCSESAIQKAMAHEAYAKASSLEEFTALGCVEVWVKESEIIS
jgi:hypothetical protein